MMAHSMFLIVTGGSEIPSTLKEYTQLGTLQARILIKKVDTRVRSDGISDLKYTPMRLTMTTD